MSKLRKRIEQWFEDFAGLIYRYRLLTLVVMTALVAGLVSGIPKLTIDTSTEGFLHEDDPILRRYEIFRDQFGRDDIIIIAVEPTELFDAATLAKIRALHDDLIENVPHLNDITSMVNARDTRGEGDLLIVEDLLERRPETAEQLADLRQRVMANPLYRNRLVSEDGGFTTVVIEIDAYGGDADEEEALTGFDDESRESGEAMARTPAPLSDEEYRTAVAAVRNILARHRSEDFKLYLAGMPVVTDALKTSLVRDMGLFIRLALLTIAVCLFVMFRRVTGVVLPLLIVALSLASTLGTMGHLGVAVKIPTVILPSFILAVGVGAAVHLLAIFFRNLQRSGDKRRAIVEAMGHSGLAIAMTSLTTAVGLGSFATAEVAPVADLGRFASLGVLLALVYTIFLLPALLALIPLKPKKVDREGGRSPVADRFLDAVTDFSTGHPRAIAIASVLVIAVSLVGAVRLSFSHDVMSWLPDAWAVHRATDKIDQELKGSVAVEVILDTGRENGLYEPAVLKTLDRLARDIEAIELGTLFVGKVTSVADILKEIHQALNENRPDYYVIPDDAKLIAQEFLLFENSGSDDLENVIDSRFQLARFTVRVPWRDTLEYVPFIREVESRFRRALGDQGTITVTGMMSLLSRTMYAAIHSAGRSYVLAFVLITVMMILLIGSLKLGFISMLPNLAPIVVTLGLMGWFDFPLDMFTMLIGSIAIGLAVDDTIHFMHNFRRYHDETGDVVESVRATLHTAGRAMVVTTVVLSLGFFIYMFAAMNNVFYFGLLTGLTIVLALAADFLMAPALMVLTHRAPTDRSEEGSQPGDRP